MSTFALDQEGESDWELRFNKHCFRDRDALDAAWQTSRRSTLPAGQKRKDFSRDPEHRLIKACDLPIQILSRRFSLATLVALQNRTLD